MEDKQDREDLTKKVKEMFRIVAIEKYGFPKILSRDSRDKWEKVNAAAKICIESGEIFSTIKQAVINVVKDHPKYFPPPIMFEGELLRIKNLAKKQNTKVDVEFEEAHKMSLLRERKRTEIIEQFGVPKATKMEDSYAWLKGNVTKTGEAIPLAYWHFYEALVRQDKDAMAIINSHEKINRTTDTKCDT